MYSKKKAFAFLSLFLGLTLSCSHTANIKLVGQYEVPKIPDYSVLPDYYRAQSVDRLNKYYGEGFHALVFSSSLNLGKVIERWEMSHLYYKITICGTSDEEKFFLGRVFPASPGDLKAIFLTEKDPIFHYVAYLPMDYRGEERLQGAKYLVEMEEGLKKYGACFKIGAGAMHGPNLTSNTLKIDYRRP